LARTASSSGWIEARGSSTVGATGWATVVLLAAVVGSAAVLELVEEPGSPLAVGGGSAAVVLAAAGAVASAEPVLVMVSTPSVLPALGLQAQTTRRAAERLRAGRDIAAS